jgi:hypothetical protein
VTRPLAPAGSKPSLLRRLFTPVGHPAALADEHGFLQARIGLYTKTLFAFLAIFALLGLIKLMVLGFGGSRFMRYNLLSEGLFLFLATGMGFDAWYFNRATRSLRMLHLYETFGTLFVSTGVATLIFTLPPEFPEIGMLGAPILILVIRAAIVPSTVLRTIFVGLGSTLIYAVITFVRLRRLSGHLDFFRTYAWLTMAGWCLVFTVATAVVSRVIYGLQRTVREVLRLGQYAIEEKLGEGGFGTVYLARHALLRRPTAVKVLRPDLGEASVRRFEREVRETSRLRHPNTVVVFDYGHTAEGVFYYAMEYLDGLTLDALVEIGGPLPPGRAVYVVTQAAHALAEAHGIGLVHRDIKPQNIMLTNTGGVADSVRVLDFGLVKDVRETGGQALSHADAVVGTPLYLAPESVANPMQADHRVDLYALGCVLHYLLTGADVFPAGSLVEVCAHHLHTEPEPPSRHAAGISPALDALVLRCLRKNPNERFQDALSLWRDLRALPEASTWNIDLALDWWHREELQIRALRAKRRQHPESSDTIAVALDRAPRD